MTGGLKAKIFERGVGQVRHLLVKPRGSSGFTIIEVLIVLAVTGFLFIGAALLIAGRQAQTEFNQAIRQVQTQIQQVINDVATGYYPNTNSLQCTAGPTGPNLSPGSTDQGANAGCIFVGKALQFDVAETSPEQFAVLTVAGLQKTSSGSEVTSLSQARPTAVAPASSSDTTPNLTVTNQLNGGLTTVDMWYDNGAGERPIGIVAFVNSFAAPGSTIVSGTQQVGVAPVDDAGTNSALDRSFIQGAQAINGSLGVSTINPSGGVFLCFRSGGTNQSGLITIGDQGRQLSVTLAIKSNQDCS